MYPVTDEPLDDWATTGWPLPTTSRPSPTTTRSDVYDETIELDETGLRIYLRIDGAKERAHHPVAYAQYGLSAFIEYERTGDPSWLASAIRHGEALREMRIERDGAWWYPYDFKWTYYQRTLNAPWWSLMAQGEAISLYTRLATETGDPDGRWREAADRTWESFRQEYASPGPWGSLVIEDHLYFEAFASDNQAPLLVANTHVFAMFGLYDYWRLHGQSRSRPVPSTAEPPPCSIASCRWCGSRASVMNYCVQAEYCQSPLWQNTHYHPIFVGQLATLAEITGDARFADWSALLASDWQPSPFEAARGYDFPHFEPGVEPLEMGAIRP